MSLDPLHLLAQFLIAALVFSFSMGFFFNKLLAVLRERELNTTLLIKEADDKLAKAQEMVGEYEKKIGETYGRAQKKLEKGRESSSQKEDLKYKEQTLEISKRVQEERNKMVQDVGSKKREVLEQADGLSNALVDRLTG
ncbi:MAG: hypothetical protein OXB88_03370 [Bacteriovoracales bacterium]|nr:hypothetical protein [Bacteriovoracales bacterium]